MKKNIKIALCAVAVLCTAVSGTAFGVLTVHFGLDGISPGCRICGRFELPDNPTNSQFLKGFRTYLDTKKILPSSVPGDVVFDLKIVRDDNATDLILQQRLASGVTNLHFHDSRKKTCLKTCDNLKKFIKNENKYCGDVVFDFKSEILGASEEEITSAQKNNQQSVWGSHRVVAAGVFGAVAVIGLLYKFFK